MSRYRSGLHSVSAALVVLLLKLPAHLSITDALTVAGGFHKLEAVDFSMDVKRRYTFWSGLFGGFFVAVPLKGLSPFSPFQSKKQLFPHGRLGQNA